MNKYERKIKKAMKSDLKDFEAWSEDHGEELGLNDRPAEKKPQAKEIALSKGRIGAIAAGGAAILIVLAISFAAVFRNEKNYLASSDNEQNNSSSAVPSEADPDNIGGSDVTDDYYVPDTESPSYDDTTTPGGTSSPERSEYETSATEKEAAALTENYSFLKKFHVISTTKRMAVYYLSTTKISEETLYIMDLEFLATDETLYDDYVVTAYFENDGTKFELGEDNFYHLTNSFKIGDLTVYYLYDEEICVHFLKADFGDTIAYLTVKTACPDPETAISDIFG